MQLLVILYLSFFSATYELKIKYDEKNYFLCCSYYLHMCVS
jgi:hypothetical protein